MYKVILLPDAEMNNKYYYDDESDSVFICMKEGKEEKFEEIAPGINIELDEKDEVIGVEILRVCERI